MGLGLCDPSPGTVWPPSKDSILAPCPPREYLAFPGGPTCCGSLTWTQLPLCSTFSPAGSAYLGGSHGQGTSQQRAVAAVQRMCPALLSGAQVDRSEPGPHYCLMSSCEELLGEESASPPVFAAGLCATWLCPVSLQGPEVSSADRWPGAHVACCVLLGGHEASSSRRRPPPLGGRWARAEGGRCCPGSLPRLHLWEEPVVWGLRSRFLTVHQCQQALLSVPMTQFLVPPTVLLLLFLKIVGGEGC